jgi:hypothetical protein
MAGLTCIGVKYSESYDLKLPEERTMTADNINPPPTTQQEQDDNLRAAYARAKQEIIERDFPHYAINEEGIPLAQVIAELEEIHKQETQQRAQG